MQSDTHLTDVREETETKQWMVVASSFASYLHCYIVCKVHFFVDARIANSLYSGGNTSSSLVLT